MLQLDLEGMTDVRSTYRSQIVKSLADFRREWQETAEGNNLIEINASVGLLFADIADRLELSPQERHVMLGVKLAKQIKALMDDRVSVNISS